MSTSGPHALDTAMDGPSVWVVVNGLKQACALNGHFGVLGGNLPPCTLHCGVLKPRAPSSACDARNLFAPPPRCATVTGVTFCHAPGAEEANKSERYPVVMHVGGNIDPDLGMPKLIKGDNIRRLDEEELQGAVRLNSHGEIGPKLQRLSLPKALRVCAQAPSAGYSPVLSLCGEPVCVVKVSQPHDDVQRAPGKETHAD